MANAAFIAKMQLLRAETNSFIVSYKLTDIQCLLAERRRSALFFFLVNEKRCRRDDCDVRKSESLFAVLFLLAEGSATLAVSRPRVEPPHPHPPTTNTNTRVPGVCVCARACTCLYTTVCLCMCLRLCICFRK